MIVTFYSFKGGVGRSMALVNVGEILADWGYRVILCDWDLEAPGLERYLLESEAPLFKSDRRADYELELQTALSNRGLMDLLLEFKDLLTRPPQSNPPADDDSAQFVKVGNLWLRRPRSLARPVSVRRTRQGSLRLLSAGRREREAFQKYAEAVRDFDWSDFYEKWGGSSYIEFFRKDLSAGDESLQLDPAADIVLVDSRTGVTEHGGVATHHLADVVVLLSAPNEANISGTKWMATSLQKTDLFARRGGREIQLLPVEARVGVGEEKELLLDFEAFFSDEMKDALSPAVREGSKFFSTAAIPYIGYYSFRERIVAREERKHPLLYRTYELLADALIRCGLAAKPKPLVQDRVPDEIASGRRAGAAALRGPRPQGSVFIAPCAGNPELVATLRQSLGAAGVTVFSPAADKPLPLNLIEAVDDAMEKSVASLIVTCEGATPSLRAELQAAIRQQARKPGYSAVVVAVGPKPSPSSFGLVKPPVLVAPANLSPGDSPFFETLAAELSTPAPTESLSSVNPFGVDFNDSESACFFFGRDAQLHEVVRLMEEGLRAGASHWLAIEGSSGSGKTAFVRAALLPAIQRGLVPSLPQQSIIAISAFRTDFMLDLATALCATDQFSDRNVAEVRERLAAGSSGLRDLVAEKFKAGRPLVLVIDAFEALFLFRGAHEATPGQGSDANALLDALSECVDGSLPFHLVTISRSDVALSSALGALDIHAVSYEINEMTDDELREAIALPAHVTGARFESGLIERLLDDARQAEQGLPLLQQMLRQMWADSDGGVLTHASYDRVGGLGGLQIAAAERYFGRLTGKEQTVARSVLVRLAWAARRGAALTMGRLNDVLTDPRILRKLLFDSGLVNVTRDGVSLAHSALLRWPRLNEWVNAEAPALRHRDDFEYIVRSWIAAGRPDGGLLFGRQLEFFQDVTPLTAEELEFFSKSKEYDGFRRNRRRVGNALFATVLGAAVVWGGVLGLTRYRDRRQAKIVAARSIELGKKDPLAALILALDASAKAEVPEANTALQSAVRLPAVRQIVPFSGTLTGLALSSDGKALLVADENHATYQFLGEAPKRFDPGSGRRITFATLSSDGSRALIVDSGGVTIWAPRPKQEILRLPINTPSADLSSDGKFVAIEQIGLYVIDASNQKVLETSLDPAIVGSDRTVFSPDGRFVVFLRGANAALWDWRNGKPVTFQMKSPPTAVAFSDRVPLLAAGGERGSLELFNSEGKIIWSRVSGDSRSIADIAFGREVAVATSSGELLLISIPKGELHVLKTSDHRVKSLAFGPDDRKLVTCGDDGAFRIWNTDSWQIEQIVQGHTGAVLRAVFSGGDSHLLATAGADNVVREWDLEPADTLVATGHISLLRALAETRVPANLSSADRARILKQFTP